MTNEKASKDKSIQDLHRFLKERNQKKEESIKSEPMSSTDISAFLDNKVMPAYKTLKTTMSEFNLGKIDYNKHVKVATFKISESRTQFFFKVEIDNLSRKIKIYPILKYRTANRGKLLNAEYRDVERIPFKELDKITEKKIIALFTDWYMSKEEQIKTHGNKN